MTAATSSKKLTCQNVTSQGFDRSESSMVAKQFKSVHFVDVDDDPIDAIEVQSQSATLTSQ